MSRKVRNRSGVIGTMGSLKILEEKIKDMEVEEKEKEFSVLTSPANDNSSVSNVVDSLTKALSTFLNKDQVKELVQKEIHDFKCTHTIELKKDGEVVTLPDGVRHYLFPEVLQTVDLSIPAALIGPAGSGKSTLCEQISKALGLKFHLQNGVTGVHELTGYMDAHGRYISTPFRSAFEHGGCILIDEVDTSEAGALKWVNTALANGHAAFPDSTTPVVRHSSFRIIIAANTWGSGADRLYVGSNQIDASTLDRFVFFDFLYDEKLEELVAGDPMWVKKVQKLRRAANDEKARIVISPRASIHGAKLIKIGWKPSVVEERIIWKGIDKDLKERILKRAA
jgi:cobaltochelatase CobS